MLGSLHYTVNVASDHDHGLQLAIPSGFGDAEFTLELWIKPDNTFPVGPVADGTPGQLTNWSDVDIAPYTDGTWWFSGNFLLDGHNNGNFSAGTFSLQFYGSGRLRWLFGDQGTIPAGGVWAVGSVASNPNLLDGQWHQVTLVRRWAGQTDADLELWIDGTLIETETSDVRSDMRGWWNSWPGWGNQAGWFWGAEKQACVGVLSQYEDFKGLLAEVRFWSIAKTTLALSNDWASSVVGNEAGLVGWFPMNEGSGTTTCDVLDATNCISLIQMKPGYWDSEGPPLQ